jgi:hypothetical protein
MNTEKNMGRNFLAILLAFIFIIPTYIVGHIASVIYLYLLKVYTFGFDFFGIEFLQTFFTIYFQNLLKGVICGALSIFITSKIIKQADYRIVAYSLITVLVIIWGLVYIFTAHVIKVYQNNLSEHIYNLFEIIILLGSFGIGAFLASGEFEKNNENH